MDPKRELKASPFPVGCEEGFVDDLPEAPVFNNGVTVLESDWEAEADKSENTSCCDRLELLDVDTED